MENSTSFDLNRNIQQWRENLAAAPSFRNENLDELETHLRDSVAVLQNRGLSADEAFLIATRRMGAGDPLANEFSKVNGSAIWLDRLFWMVIGYQAWLFISGVTVLVIHNALFLGLNYAGYNFKAHGNAIPTTLFTLVRVAGFAGSLALCGWLFCRKGQRFGRWLGRLLQRRTTWALTFSVLYVLYSSIGLATQGMNSLLSNSIGQERVIEFYNSQGYSILFTHLITAAIVVWLTVFLARRRLCAGQT